MRGDVSSQFLSALLLALPLVSAHGPITIDVDGELISRPYVEITLNLLARFGITVETHEWRRFVIPAGSAYRSPGDIHVEGDASSASYFIALGAIAATDQPIRIEGVGADSIQGDIRFVDAARAMGADVTLHAGHLEVRRGQFPLQAITLDCNHIPDAAMTLASMALFAQGTTRLRNIASWRVKETDRITAMATELIKLGATVREGADFIDIEAPTEWRAASIHTYDDHRIAMCFSLAAFNPLAAGAGPTAVPVRILDPQCVGKTFPDYFETLFGVVQTAEQDIPVITVDGPTASGKGTLASALAARLGYHFLDSGAVYRATALSAMRAGVAADDETRPRSNCRQTRPAVPARADPDVRRGRHRNFAPGRGRRAGLESVGLADGARRVAPISAAAAPGAGAGGRWARHGDRDLPGRRPEGVPHRERRNARGTPPQAIDYKGDFG